MVICRRGANRLTVRSEAGTRDAFREGSPTPMSFRSLSLNARHLALSLVLAASAPGAILAQTAEPERPPLFTKSDWVAAGAVTAGTLILTVYDDDIARWVRDDGVQENATLRTSRSFANRINESTMGVGSVALWGIGRLTGQRTLSDVSIHMAEAVLVASVAAQLVRGPLGRARPSVADSLDGEELNQYIFHPFKGFTEFGHRAFPSIHTSSGFAVAAVLSGEAAHRWPDQRKWIAPLAYAIAATPGLARMHLDQHWASDVLMGAFFGVLAGQKVVKYNHEVNPGNKVDRFFLGAGGVDPQQRTVLFEMTRRF